MLRRHRIIHRITWLVLTPALLLLILVFSRPDANLTPPNADLPGHPAAVAGNDNAGTIGNGNPTDTDGNTDIGAAGNGNGNLAAGTTKTP